MNVLQLMWFCTVYEPVPCHLVSCTRRPLRVLRPGFAFGILSVGFCFVACTPATAEAGSDDARDRLISAMAFGDRLLDREFEVESRWAFYEGRGVFDSGQADAMPVREGFESSWTILRGDRQACRLIQRSSFGWIKLMSTPERHCNINYSGEGTDTEISTFGEGPVDRPVPEYAAVVGDGIWFGHLISVRFPEFSRFVHAVDWQQTSDGMEIRGVYESWEMTFTFADNVAEVPTHVEMRNLHADPSDSEPIEARRIAFVEWDEFDGIFCPRTVVAHDLSHNADDEWLSFRNEMTVVSIGPVTEFSERYGDFFTDVPDGSSVQVDDYMGIEFIWQDGEIVRKVDRAKLSSMIGQPFFGSPLRRFVLMGAGLCALAAAGWFVYRRSSGRGESRVT